MSDVGERIIKLCDAQGISIKQLAERSEIPISTIKSIVDAKSTNTRIATVQKICKGFGVTLTEFFE